MTHDHRGVFRKGLASFGGNNFRTQFKITETKNTFLTFCVEESKHMYIQLKCNCL